MSWTRPPGGQRAEADTAAPLLDRPGVRSLAWLVAVAFGLVVVFRMALPRPVPLGILLLGLVIGSINALVAIGLILIYRANRIINFAGAEIGVFGAIVFQNLLGRDLPWVVAAVVGVVCAAALSALSEMLIMRRFARAPRLIATVATIGLAQLVVVLTYVVSNQLGGSGVGGEIRTPFSGFEFHVGTVVFTGDALLLAASVPLVVFVLDIFLRRTDFGVAVRASAESSERAELLGIPVKRVITVLWIVAGATAGLATILQAPVVGLVSGSTLAGPTLLLRGLTAAVLAKMDNLRVAVAAALGLGVIDQSVYFGKSGSTVSNAVFVAIIVVALIFQRQQNIRFTEGSASAWAAVEEVRPVPRQLRHLPEVQWGRIGLVAAVATAAIGFGLIASPSRANLGAAILIYAIVAVSLVVLTGWAGQISLGQFGIVGVGAAIGARLAADANWDFLAAMVGAGVAGAVVALLLGTVALRVRGFFFAVSSLAFAVAVETFFLNTQYFEGLVPTNRPVRPILFNRWDLESEPAFYGFCLALLVIVLVAVAQLRRSRTGRAIIAVRDNDRAAQSYGISATRAKLTAFAISGFIAGLAGALLGAHQHSITASAFSANESVRVFSMVVIGGLGSLPGAVLGAVYVRGASYFLSANLALLASGAGLLAVLLVVPGGLGHIMYSTRDRFLRVIAKRRGLVVPSLNRDQRTEPDATPEFEPEPEPEPERELVKT